MLIATATAMMLGLSHTKTGPYIANKVYGNTVRRVHANQPCQLVQRTVRILQANEPAICHAESNSDSFATKDVLFKDKVDTLVDELNTHLIQLLCRDSDGDKELQDQKLHAMNVVENLSDLHGKFGPCSEISNIQAGLDIIEYGEPLLKLLKEADLMQE